MFKHTQAIRRQIANELFECVSPFCGVDTYNINPPRNNAIYAISFSISLRFCTYDTLLWNHINICLAAAGTFLLVCNVSIESYHGFLPFNREIMINLYIFFEHFLNICDINYRFLQSHFLFLLIFFPFYFISFMT